MHVDLDAIRTPCAHADEQVFHQPAIFLTTGFEFRHRAEIDQSGIDDLALGDPIQQILRTEPDTNVLDIDDRAIVHLKGVFCLQFGKAIRTNDLEIRTDRKDRSLDARPANFAAENRNDPPDAIADIAGHDRRAYLDGEAEDISRLELGHPSARPSCVAAARSRATETRSGSPGEPDRSRRTESRP